MLTAQFDRRQVLFGMMLGAATSLAPASILLRKAEAASAKGHPYAVTSKDYLYFSPTEVAFLEAAVDVLIPPDENGPGAKDAGVVLFIDRQMAGPFGRAEDWYMQPPFAEGSEQQGYQLSESPAALYRSSIRMINEYCRKAHDGKAFHELDASEQETVLAGVERNELNLPGRPAGHFFEMLRNNTVEGYFADPLYGGNRDFAGWKLIGFPGPRYDYTDYITRYGERYPHPTVGILGRNYPAL